MARDLDELSYPRDPVSSKVGRVTGIANDQSIAYGCARALRDVGASLAITYLKEKVRPYVEPLPGAELFLPLDVRETPQMTGVFAAIREKWDRLDFLVHSLAFAPKADLQGRLVVIRPFARASRRIAAPYCSSTRMPAASRGTS